MKATKMDYIDMRLRCVDKRKIFRHITWRTKASNGKPCPIKKEEKEE